MFLAVKFTMLVAFFAAAAFTAGSFLAYIP